jgi:N-acetylglucosaminyldiphosphoundecaprenol N-acetyl-beta-D-mannosaminyltransferase
MHKKNGKVEKSPRAGRANVLVLGRIDKRLRELERVMSQAFLEVVLVSEWSDAVGLFPSGHFDLIILTDSSKDNLKKNLLISLKRLYSQAKVLCVFDSITEEIEITMRSVGIIYLGSFEHFVRFSRDILESAVKPCPPL